MTTTLPQTLPNSSQKLLNESWQYLRENMREEMHLMANPPPSFYQFLQRTISFKPHPRADHLANLASQISEISQIPPIYAQPCQVHGSRFTVDRSPFTIHYSLFTIHRSP